MRAIFIIAFVLLTFSKVKCSSKTEEKKVLEPPLSVHDKEERSDFDLTEIMNECNETFRIEMSYIEALNTSGSFPDETDKTPKCYVRCVLERSLVATEEGEFDVDRTVAVLAGVRGERGERGAPSAVRDMAAGCSNRSETCKCERSYQYMRCLIQMDIENKE